MWNECFEAVNNGIQLIKPALNWKMTIWDREEWWKVKRENEWEMKEKC